MTSRAKPEKFDALIGLGSNIGDKTANITRAITLLTFDGAITLAARSRDWKSAAWGKRDQDWFVNAAIAVKTSLPARELLTRCQSVENEMGRVRREHWGPRVIDVDILTYRSDTIDAPDLKVPHPLITERAFVLAPLADIAPDLKLRGQSVKDWLAACTDADTVEAIAPDAK